MADIVKVSDEDLDWIAKNSSGEDTITSWLSESTKIVLFTRGAGGATAFTRSGSIDLPALKVDVVDTIGAGDTFNAGFLSGLRQSGLLLKSRLANLVTAELKPALELAIKTAALTVSKAGADSPWSSEL